VHCELARLMQSWVWEMEVCMRLAVPIWNERVSPVFDTASWLLLVEVERGAEAGRQIVDMAMVPFPTQRARRLTDLHVNVLICGAISRPQASFVSAAGIEVIPWVAGPVEDVLRAYLAGRISKPCWRMPGCAEEPSGHGRRMARQRGLGRRGGRTGRRL